MTALVDTNVLVRVLSGDPADQAAAARRLLVAGEELILTDLIFAEVIYVLRSVSGMDRSSVAVAAKSLLNRPNVKTNSPQLLERAIDIYRNHPSGFADAYLIACAEQSGVGRIASFDRGFDRVPTVERVEP